MTDIMLLFFITAIGGLGALILHESELIISSETKSKYDEGKDE